MLLEGIPIAPGLASGIAVIYDYEVERKLELPHRGISQSDVPTEHQRLDSALEQSEHDLGQVERAAHDDPRLVEAATLGSAHATMAREIAQSAKQRIEGNLVNVEQALDSAIREWTDRLQKLDNEYLQQREQDVRDVGRRMRRSLAGGTSWSNEPLPPGSVIVARELLPIEAVELAHAGAIAIVSEHGGTLSHTAIVARSLGIPAVSGVADVTQKAHSGAKLLVDGSSGTVTIGPTAADEEDFRRRKQDYERQAASLGREEQRPCITRDGCEVALLGNIGSPSEVALIEEHNLAGIGLFRSELLFFEAHERPSMQTQLDVYTAVANDSHPRPLVIRTFDLGGDKVPPFLALDHSQHHAKLHLRGLRFLLSEKGLLDDQLRAIVQVAQIADVRILFPMVIDSHEFAQAVAAVDRAVEELGLPQRPPVGVMVETPAALYMLEEILELADFVAIGTNDLTQYILAADRDLAEGPDDCTALHPAVLRALDQVVAAASRWNRSLCVCGEEAGDISFACLLVGLGVRELSLSPDRAAEVRQAIRRTDSRDAAEIAQRALGCRSPGEVRELISRLGAPSPERKEGNH